MKDTQKRRPRKALRIVGAILLLAVAAVAVLFSMNWREVPKMVDGVEYQVPHKSDTAEVVGCDPEATALVIQPEWRGKPVAKIDSQVFNGSKAETVEIPDTVKTLAWNAFEDSAIRSVTIPASVKEIGGHAFKDCAALEEVIFEGKPSLGDGVFEGCAALEKLTVQYLGDIKFACPTLKSVTIKRAIPASQDKYSYSSWGFLVDCKALEEIHIPGGFGLDHYNPPPNGATVYVKDAYSALAAINRGWSWAVEEGAKMRQCELSEALESGDVRLRVDVDERGDDCVVLDNESEDILILAWNNETAPAELVDGERHFIVRSLSAKDANEHLVLGHGKAEPLTCFYYDDYGPGETRIDFVTGDDYAHIQVLKGAMEIAWEADMAPNERQTLTLPEGRYGIMQGYGDSAESARANLGGELHSDYSNYADYPAGALSEFNMFHGFMKLERLGEYGPETSSLLVKARDKKVCYRLYRVGGDLEKEIQLFEKYSSQTISFPAGRYLLRIAEGDEWLSDEEAFGPDGEYSMIEYFNFEPGETYHVTTTTADVYGGTVQRDSAAGFNGG